MKQMKKILLLLLPAVLLFGCSREDRYTGGKSVFRYNEAAGISSLDPAFSRDQANIWATHQLFNGLVQLDNDLEIIPCIARSWQISENGRVYEFRLRNDVYFHDSPVFPAGKGRRVKASDFAYSFSRVVDPKVASPGTWIFSYVHHAGNQYSFETPDDSTFRITLERPYPPFLGLLTTLYCSVIPKEGIDFYGGDFRKNPVGTGPFLFKMWKEGIKLVLVKNQNYFETENGSRLPYLDAVAISFLSDKQSAFLEFIKGNLDFMSGIDPSYKDELLTPEGKLDPRFSAKITLLTGPYLNTEYLGFLLDAKNPSGLNPAAARKVRQAVNYAFDRTKMVRYLRNRVGTPGISGIVPRGMPSFDSTSVCYDYDPVKAARLLAEAGFPGGKGLPSLALSTTSDYLDLCKYIQHQVAEIGIPMTIDITPPAAMKEMKAQAKLPFFRASWIADYPDAESYLSLFCSRNFCPSGPNYTHYANAEYDRLYEQAMTLQDDESRFALYRRMEKLMMEDAPVVVLYYDEVLRFVRKNITGLGSDPMNLLTLKKVKKSGR
jgi:ABC-type transport system substrate-binding protein